MQLNSSLFSVVSRGDDTAVRDLLKKGADANARDDNGCTPIARAVSGGYLSTVKLLLESGADVNTPCNHGPNALSLASSRGQEAIVLLLIEKGADENRRGQQGWYPISDAIEAGHAGIVRALMEHGAQINVSYSYFTPLIHAAERGRTEIVKMLLDGGADVRAIDHNGMSALLQAIDKGYPEIAKILIERGSDVNIRAGNGYRPLALARSKQQESVVQALQAAGAVERAGPTDPFVEAAAKEQAKIDKVRKELEQGGWEFFIRELSVLHYLKPSQVALVGNGIYRIPTMEFYTNSDELFETLLEMNCSGKKYKHISNLQRDISGTPIRNISVDSYVLNDRGKIQEGSAMHALFKRVCASFVQNATSDKSRQSYKGRLEEYLQDKYKDEDGTNQIKDISVSIQETVIGPRGSLWFSGLIRPKNFKTISGDKSARAIAMAFLKDEAELLGLPDSNEIHEFEIFTYGDYDGEHTGLYYERYIGNFPLIDVEFYFDVGPDGTIRKFSALIIPVTSEVYSAVAKKTITEDDALKVVERNLNAHVEVSKRSYKSILNRKYTIEHSPYVIWWLEVKKQTGEMYRYHINALTGDIIRKDRSYPD